MRLIFLFDDRVSIWVVMIFCLTAFPKVTISLRPNRITAFHTNKNNNYYRYPAFISSNPHRTSQPHYLLAGLGDLFAALVGTPPTSLEPPKELLIGTSMDPVKSNLQRCYKASVDGWSAVDFHNCVDGRGSCFVSALSTKSDKRFGGFNPLGWRSTDDYGTSNAAFLWFESSATKVVKVPVLPGGGACLFDYASSGPCFGAGDLIIGPSQAAVMGFITGPNMENTAVNAGSLKLGRSSPGGAYESPIGWPCRGEFRLVEVEVYCNGNVRRM